MFGGEVKRHGRAPPVGFSLAMRRFVLLVVRLPVGVYAMLGLDGPADDAADKAEAKKALEALRGAAGRSAPSGAAEQQAAAVAARKQRETLQRRAPSPKRRRSARFARTSPGWPR